MDILAEMFVAKLQIYYFSRNFEAGKMKETKLNHLPSIVKFFQNSNFPPFKIEIFMFYLGRKAKAIQRTLGK